MDLRGQVQGRLDGKKVTVNVRYNPETKRFQVQGPAKGPLVIDKAKVTLSE